MLKWNIWEGSEDAWDKLLINSGDYNIFQSFAWGRYKSSNKWFPFRYYCADKNGNTLCMTQILLIKFIFGIVFIWCPGGIVFKFKSNINSLSKEVIESFIVEMQSTYPKSLIRFHSLEENTSRSSYFLQSLCSKPYFKINSGYSVHYDIPSSSQEIRDKMLPKHRYYTKKSSEAGISWSAGNNNNILNDFAELHKEMVRNKKINLHSISYEYLENMRNNLGDKMFILVGYLNKQPVTSCLVLLFGSKAFYMAASTSQKGREVSAAYTMFENLIHKLFLKGITQFDFGGVDPFHQNAMGVNHYKCGFGGDIIEQIGEWEFATSEILRILINYIIKLKIPGA